MISGEFITNCDCSERANRSGEAASISAPAVATSDVFAKDKNHFNDIKKDIKTEIGKFISIMIREANTPDIKEYTKGAVYCGNTDKYMAVVNHIAEEKKYSFRRMSGKDIGYCIINIPKIRKACEKAGLTKEKTREVIDKEISLTKQYLSEFTEKSLYVNGVWRKGDTKGVLHVFMVLKHIHLPN